MIGRAIPFVNFNNKGNPRCYVCGGPDDYSVRDPDETLRAILCERHVDLGRGMLLVVRDRRPMREGRR